MWAGKERLSREGRSLSLLCTLWLLPTAFVCSTRGQPGGSDAGYHPDGDPIAPALDPGRKDIHRLNSTEYSATIQDVLGTKLQPVNGSWRGGELAGFDNIASVLGVDEAQYERYFNSAKDLATEVLASEPLRGRFVACALRDPACVTSSIAAAGLRVLRRPLEPEEAGTYQRVYDSARAIGDDERAAFALTLQTLLSSAEFLYRIEVDPKPESIESHPLDPFELASRLSYFLWSSAPDDPLLRAAADGSLTQPAALSATVDRMLNDPRSERLVANFAGQWLGARDVLSHPVAPKYFQWSPQVAHAASQEIISYFSEFLKSGRSWFEFPTADINFVDAALGYFYKIPTTSPDVGIFERVEYRADERAGFFGLAGFLAVSSFDRRTSPSRRGRWIAGNLLCADPPAPPPNVPELEDDDRDGGADPSSLNVRQTLEEHRASPACAGCHALFDAYGLALEHFDGVGLHRSRYEDGTPIDASVTLPASPAHPDGLPVSGLDELSRAVSTDPRFGACLARKLYTYGLGRTMTASDEPQLQRALDEWLVPGQTPSVRRLIQTLISTEAFRFRRGGG